jgi:hypothetical protein
VELTPSCQRNRLIGVKKERGKILRPFGWFGRCWNSPFFHTMAFLKTIWLLLEFAILSYNVVFEINLVAAGIRHFSLNGFFKTQNLFGYCWNSRCFRTMAF